MRRTSKLISAIPLLYPDMIVNVSTGEYLTAEEFNISLKKLTDYCQTETERLFAENKTKLLADVSEYRSNPNGFGRQKGYYSGYKNLPREVKAKSRVNEIVLYKLISETSSYVNNPTTGKQEPVFSNTVNLGAVDKQMVTLAADGNKLTLLFKCWDTEYYLEFTAPGYVLERDITKWSLPLIKPVGANYGFIFSTIETIPERAAGNHVAGIDLGLKEPYVAAVVNRKGNRVAHYTASKNLKRLQSKRSNLLTETNKISAKINSYTQLGLDSSVLKLNRSFVSSKASRLGSQISKLIGNEVTAKLDKHALNLVHVENLAWVSGSTGSKIGSSRWSHSQQQEKITHSLLRKGIQVRKVNPRDSSNLCHKCGMKATHSARNVLCKECKTVLDRDFNAAMNIASLNHLKKRFPLPDRGKGDKCRGKAQLVTLHMSNSVPKKLPQNASFATTTT